MAFELSAEAVRRAREAFQRVVESAVPAYELGQLQLFHEEDEAFIRKEVERKLYEPQLPNGGAKERKIVERLKKLALEDWEGNWRASMAVRHWREVLSEDPRNPGRYYILHKLSPREGKEDFNYYLKLKEYSDGRRDWDKKWFAELMLAGLPSGVSNFRVECLFLLRGADANVTRLVRLRNMIGEVSRGLGPGGSEILDAEALAAPEKFRRWCLSKGSFNWGGNQKELQTLHEDLWREGGAWRVVTRVDSCGWMALGKVKNAERRMQNAGDKDQSLLTSSPTRRLRGIWFFDDCAYGEPSSGGASVMITPDDDGIIWFEGEGYYLGQKGREASFVQKRPRMRPMKTDRKPDGPTAEQALADSFYEVCLKLYETLGGYEGWMAVGAVLAFAAGPEVFDLYRFCGGLWAHGQKGGGKTSLVNWLMKFWGFDVSSGLALSQKTCTAVGILQQTENYSYLPLWLDEFRDHQIGEDKAGVLRVFYDRSGQAKWSPDGVERVLKTGALVSGESTSSDAATRSRYPHVQCSKHKWVKEHGPWLDAHAADFYLFGRRIMERRGEYVEKFLEGLNEWLKEPELAKMDDRERKVHGVAYAGFVAMARMLRSHAEAGTFDTAFDNVPEAAAGAGLTLKKFKEFMLGYSKSAAQDVEEETNVNVFWADMVTAFKDGAIKLDCFRLESKPPLERPPGVKLDENGRSRQGRWTPQELYIHPELMISQLQMWLTKQRGSVVLKRKDLRDQSSKNDWWIHGKLRKRFGSGEGVTACWGIQLDKHPLGYQGPVSDEEFEGFLLKPNAGDPRKGPLYEIVERLHAQDMAAVSAR